MRSKIAFRTSIVGSLSLLAVYANAQAPNVTFTDIHDFGAKENGPLGPQQYDGSQPQSKVTFDQFGNMYGVCSDGAYRNGGLVWEMSTNGTYTVLHNFGGTITNSLGKTGADGSGPRGSIAVDSYGNVYGTTFQGGAANEGMLWEVTYYGTYLDLHDFGLNTTTHADNTVGLDGFYPVSGVTFDSAGNLYGTTSNGGEYGGDGMVWRYSVGQGYQDLHDFGAYITTSGGGFGSDGHAPVAAVSFDTASNMYGTTEAGGPNGAGMLWEITSGGAYKDLHDFGGNTNNKINTSDGTYPSGPVVIDGSYNIYGTTPSGGPTNDGIIWKLSSSGDYSILHKFGSTITRSNGQSGIDGEMPNGDIAINGSGDLFGTTSMFDNPTTGGMVWEYTSSGSYVDLHDFGVTKVANTSGGMVWDGQIPMSGVTFDQAGNLYGTTESGGAVGTSTYGAGMVYAMGYLSSVGVVNGSVGGGTKVTGVISLGMAAPIGGTRIMLSSSDANAAPPSYIVIPVGGGSALFTIGTARVTAADTVTITASQMYATATTTLTVNPATITGFSYFNGPKGGSTATINVNLSAPAPTGGLNVTLTPSSPAAQVPPAVFVPAGSTSASFPVNYSSVRSATPVTITGTIGTVSATAYITINP